MSHRWAMTVASLAGEPLPPLPALPGRQHHANDRPLTADEMAGITSPAELGLILGISRQAASVRLRKLSTPTDTLAPAKRPVIRLPARKAAP